MDTERAVNVRFRFTVDVDGCSQAWTDDLDEAKRAACYLNDSCAGMVTLADHDLRELVLGWWL